MDERQVFIIVDLGRKDSMSEQAPHVEVFSRNKVSRSRISLVAVVIPVMAISGFAVYALLPFIVIIGYGLLALATIGALYLVALLFVDIYQRWLQAPYIHVSEQNGMFNTKAGRMYPLALPAPHVTVREDKETEAELDKNIIDLWKGGRHSYRAIAEDLKTNYPRVQKVLADYKKQQGIA